MSEIGEDFRAIHGVKVYYNFAASTTLQRQLEKGASADVFISASPQQVNSLEKQGLLDNDNQYNLLTNRLVLVSHNDSNLSYITIDSLRNDTISRIAIGQPEIVPAGTYAKQALIHLNLWEKLYSKLVFAPDVRSTLAYVTAGNVDVGIVYQTDIKLSKNVKVLDELPPESHIPIVYPAVILKETEYKQMAKQFLNYLQSRHTIDIFSKHGFIILPNQQAQ